MNTKGVMAFVDYVYIMLLTIIIIALGILLITTFSDNEKVKANPLVYGAAKYNLTNCVCFTEKGGSVMFNGTQFFDLRSKKLNIPGINDSP